MPDSPYVKGRRLRIFGGPNGSGKTTIINLIRSSFDVGHYINADDIENEIKSSGKFNIQRFGLVSDSTQFADFVNNHPSLLPNFFV